MSNLPSDVLQALTEFSKDLKGIETTVADFVQLAPEQRDNLSPLERARRDLAIASAVHSLYCMHASTSGREPIKEETVGVESRRIQGIQNRLEDLEIRARPQIDKRIAKALIRNALFDTSASGSDTSMITSNINNCLINDQGEPFQNGDDDQFEDEEECEENYTYDMTQDDEILDNF